MSMKMNKDFFNKKTHELLMNQYISLGELELDISLHNKKDFVKSYYSDLERDMKDVHANRDRARDVLRYSRMNDELVFSSEEKISLVNKNYAGTREYKRIVLIDHPLCRLLAKIFLTIIPKNEQKPQGLLGINLFRTYGVITETRHKDEVDYVLIYCLNVNGKGAMTQLTKDKEGKMLLKETFLHAGDIFIFKDEPFYHFTTPLIKTDANPVRDVIIMTIGV